MEKNNIEELGRNLREYIAIQYELLKMQIVHKLSVSISWLLSAMILILIGFLCVLFLSLSLGIYLSEITGSYTKGFLLIGSAYFLLFLLLILFRKNIMGKPVGDKIIEESLNESED
jgi:hypothetical protein